MRVEYICICIGRCLVGWGYGSLGLMSTITNTCIYQDPLALASWMWGSFLILLERHMYSAEAFSSQVSKSPVGYSWGWVCWYFVSSCVGSCTE